MKETVCNYMNSVIMI